MKLTTPRSQARVFLTAVTLATAFACSGGQEGTDTGQSAVGGARAKLVGIEYGRLVDIYAWRRVNAGNADRKLASNRNPVLVLREVLVNVQVQNEDPITNPAARFRYLPYDPSAGHRDLLVLYDDQLERTEFEAAIGTATRGLTGVAPYYAFAQGLPTPPPLVPGDGCLRLTFDRELGLGTDYFAATPNAVQVLRLNANPAEISPSLAYSAINARVISKENGKYLLIDPEITGNEAIDRTPNPEGLPASLDAASANVRIALATSGTAAEKFRVQVDQIPTLNSVGVRGEEAVIRDVRVGNHQDANFGSLPDVEDPVVVTRKDMGILEVDLVKRQLVINKRYADVVLRGRLPFVDGPVDANGVPLGSQKVPQGRPFQSGDVIWQDFVTSNGERVRVKAEVVRNLDVPIAESDNDLGVGGDGPVARVEVSTVEAFDSRGNRFTFRANDLPLGADCTVVVHYRHEVKVQNGSKDVGDRLRIAEFLTIVPPPPRLDPVTREVIPPNERIDPTASIAVVFSKPMLLATVRPDVNVVMASRLGDKPTFLENAKVRSLAVVPTLPADLFKDATAVRLSTPVGLFHRKNTAEAYYLHLFDGDIGPRDRAGRKIDTFEGDNIPALTFSFLLDKDQADNLVGWFMRPFEVADEDGTTDTPTTQKGASLDGFGQFQMRDGRIYGLPTTRSSRVADNNTLATIRVDLQRACMDDTGARGTPTRFRYQTPLMIFQGLGGISEPFVTQGSRMQMTYREDDFALSFREKTDFDIDVEQLHWSPFVNRLPSKITYDLYDRISMTLGTSEKRPDVRVFAQTVGTALQCNFDSATWLSGLITDFAGNYLDGDQPVEVAKDVVYAINPNNAFAATTGTTFISYPRFNKTYTWRSNRITSWNPTTLTAIGLGGSQNPTDPNRPDRTRDITSPWIPEVNPDPLDGLNGKQPDDFKGDQKQDHHPIALPLLVDFFVYADDPKNGLAKSDNLFQIAYCGPLYPAPGHGYYNPGWPWLRVHTTGGIDTQQNEIIVDPKNTFTAIGGWVNNAILGRFNAPAGDDHLHWAQVDLVRKVSTVTYGYIDTLMPGKNDITGPSGWAADKNGFPNLSAVSTTLRPMDFSVVMSPTPEQLPGGTQLLVEFRGAETFDRSDVVYGATETETAASRGNLLNANYACEQYRYAASGRVNAGGLTPYVRDPEMLVGAKSLVAPRFLNWRITFTNNTAVNPARVPYLDYFAVVYRVRNPQQ